MKELSPQRQEIIEILEADGPLRSKEILSRCSLVTVPQKLSNFLYQMKLVGLVKQDELGRYRAEGSKHRDAENTTTPPAGDDEDDGVPSKLEQTVTAGVEVHLLEMLDFAQGVLDEYVFEVGDHTVLTPLMELRDKAREALQAYQQS